MPNDEQIYGKLMEITGTLGEMKTHWAEGRERAIEATRDNARAHETMINQLHEKADKKDVFELRTAMTHKADKHEVALAIWLQKKSPRLLILLLLLALSGGGGVLLNGSFREWIGRIFLW